MEKLNVAIADDNEKIVEILGRMIEEDKDLCTLLTCTPYGINTQRLLVRGKRIANRAGDASRITSDAVKVNTVVVAIIISIPLLIISFIVVDMAPRRSKKKKR